MSERVVGMIFDYFLLIVVVVMTFWTVDVIRGYIKSWRQP